MGSSPATAAVAAAASSSRISALFSSLRANHHGQSLLQIPSRISPRSSGRRSHSRPIALPARTLTAAVRSHSSDAHIPSSMGSQSPSFFSSVLSSMENVYLNRNPIAKAVVDLVSSSDGSPVSYDHFAFRTFVVDGHGIDSIAKFFLDFGYTQRDELRFPAKKLRALWFAPPESEYSDVGTYLNGPLPRIFISELLVDDISSQSQEIIRKYVKISGNVNKYAALASTLGCLTWDNPTYSDFLQLARESEYAAWTLVNGYAVNHVTISVHRLKSHIRSINMLNQFIEDHGHKLNSEGGTLKVSPDGLLLQSSTVADSTLFEFADGVSESVPCSYIEFAERLILPPYEKLADDEIKEFHRRDGFEVGNADKIFESTSKDQLTRKAA